MYELIQTEGSRVYIHGIGDSVSGLIDFYYKYRKQYGHMVVIDTSDNNRVLATMGSKL